MNGAAPDPEQLARKIIDTANKYHERRITFEQFDRVQRENWRNVHRAGLHEEVLDLVRGSRQPPPGATHNDDRPGLFCG